MAEVCTPGVREALAGRTAPRLLLLLLAINGALVLLLQLESLRVGGYGSEGGSLCACLRDRLALLNSQPTNEQSKNTLYAANTTDPLSPLPTHLLISIIRDMVSASEEGGVRVQQLWQDRSLLWTDCSAVNQMIIVYEDGVM